MTSSVWVPSCIWLFCDPMDCSPPGPTFCGIFQLDNPILQWFATPYSRGSSQPRDWIRASCISCIGRQILYHCGTREAQLIFTACVICASHCAHCFASVTHLALGKSCYYLNLISGDWDPEGLNNFPSFSQALRERREAHGGDWLRSLSSQLPPVFHLCRCSYFNLHL